MPLNYEYSFVKRSKIVFVQNEDGFVHGERINRFVTNNVKFPSYYYHYQHGGHVAALHRHLDSAYFFRIDFQNFFYSISRNRVAASLHRAGYRRARTSAKWSCVKNPIDNGIGYALPIGFVQSSALASMVLMDTNMSAALDAAIKDGIFISVYLDDIIGSGKDSETVQSAYTKIVQACSAANLTISKKKIVAPCEQLQAFNCDLHCNHASVTQKRVDEFYAVPKNSFSIEAFEAYRKTVDRLNS